MPGIVSQKAVFTGVSLGLLVCGPGLFFATRALPSSHVNPITDTDEWRKATSAYTKFQKMDPIFGEHSKWSKNGN